MKQTDFIYDPEWPKWEDFTLICFYQEFIQCKSDTKLYSMAKEAYAELDRRGYFHGGHIVDEQSTNLLLNSMEN